MTLRMSAPVVAATQAAIYVVISPVSISVVSWMKGRLQGRRGPGPLQEYRDLLKLWRIWPTVPTSASPVFVLAPTVVFSSLALLGLALPILSVPASAGVDLVLVVGLLGLAKFVTTLAAFDAASPFGPMSAGRQWFIHVFAEPALLVTTYIFALNNGTTNVARLVPESSGFSLLVSQPTISIAIAALLFVLLAESGRLPFDRPGTHLELTMIEEGVLLEYSGRALALMWWAHAMKLTFSLSLIAFLAVPPVVLTNPYPVQLLVPLAVYLAKLAVLLLVLAVWETARSKMRLRAMLAQLTLAVGVLLFALASLIVKYLKVGG